MKLPLIENNYNSITSSPLIFTGLNKKEIIEDREISDGYNLDTLDLPAISPRKPMEFIKTISNPTEFGIFDEYFAYVSEGYFYFDNVAVGVVSKGQKSLVDFNGNVLIFPDKKYYDYVAGVFGEFECPDIDYATVHYNRVFGISGSDVRASKVGDFREWEDFSGTELDSWAADVYSPGDFTGITTYQDHVVFFKNDRMYELYGYTPSQFKIVEAAKVGCIDYRSIAELGGVLFFVSERGLEQYSGGFPRNKSEVLNEKYLRACGIGDGRKYYLALDNGKSNKVYIYDTWLDTWMPYFDGDVVNFSKSNNDIYMVMTTGELYKLESGKEPFEWGFTTKNFDEGTFRKKSIKEIKLRANMDLGAELSVYVSADNRPFVLHKHIKHSDTLTKRHKDIFVSIPLKRAETYQIKVKGYGRSLIYGEREYVVGSEK